MKLVKNWSEVRRNLLTLERNRISANPKTAQKARNLIRRGTCFVVYEHQGRKLFGPSRFLGYASNTFPKHLANDEKDGTVTNPAIERILGNKFRPSRKLEHLFRTFCHERGIQPRRGKRKFLESPEARLTDFDLIQDDLQEVQKSRTTKETQKQQLMLARLGQGTFRDSLLAFWRRCPITGCRFHRLLRASHMKPWRACTNFERLDPYNGVLLSPNLDSAFDRGLITFDGNGILIRSPQLPPSEARKLGIPSRARIPFSRKHQYYLKHHREQVFQK